MSRGTLVCQGVSRHVSGRVRACQGVSGHVRACQGVSRPPQCMSGLPGRVPWYVKGYPGMSGPVNLGTLVGSSCAARPVAVALWAMAAAGNGVVVGPPQDSASLACSSCIAELPGVAMLSGLLSRACGVDVVAVVAALAGHAWAQQPALVSIEAPFALTEPTCASAAAAYRVVRQRRYSDDQAAGVVHIALVTPGGARGAQGGVERMLGLVDEAFGGCVSSRHPPPVAVHEGGPRPVHRVYAIGSPMVSHQRILRPSPTRTVRSLTDQQLRLWYTSYEHVDAHAPLVAPALPPAPLEHCVIVHWFVACAFKHVTGTVRSQGM
jgi:hypothetical protein